MLQSLKEILLAIASLFVIVMLFANGMECLTSNFSQASIIFAFAMLVPFALLQRFLTRGKFCFTADEKKTIWGAISFILFFVFFGFAVMDIEDYGLGTIGLPSAFLGLLAMFLAMHEVESLKIPKSFDADPEMKTQKRREDL